MSHTRLRNNSALQLTLGVHLALLVLLGTVHRWLLFKDAYKVDGLALHSFPAAVCAGVFLAQIGLIATWAAFSRSHSAVRAGVLVFLVPLLAAVQSKVFNDTSFFAWWFASSDDYRFRYATWTAELGVWAIALCAIFSALRGAGVALISMDSPSTNRRYSQFRLIDIAYWVVVIAMLLAAVRWLQGNGWSKIGMVVATRAVKGDFWMQGEFAGLSLLIITGLLSYKLSRIGFVAILLAPLAFGLYHDSLRWAWFPDSLSVLGVTAVMYYVFAAVFGSTLLVVRDCGYRLVWRRPWHSPPVAESP